MTEAIIGIDIGQSGSRARLAGGEDIAGPGYWSAPVATIARDLVATLLPAPATVTLGIGMTGYEPQASRVTAIGTALAEAGYAARVALADDGLTGYLGALGPVAGGMVVAGTGSVALALDPGASLVRTDGWGSELGDHGSGYWIGREAIRRALRLHDEGRTDGLVTALIEYWGPIETIAARWRASRPAIDDVAAFARPVTALAEAGNAECRAVLAEAAKHLAASLAMALRRAGLTARPVPFTALGGIFAAEGVLAAAFAAEMQALVPTAHYIPPQGDPLAGCVHLAGIKPDPVLRPLFETYGD